MGQHFGLANWQLLWQALLLISANASQFHGQSSVLNANGICKQNQEQRQREGERERRKLSRGQDRKCHRFGGCPERSL